jgi:hypothetical protein
MQQLSAVPDGDGSGGDAAQRSMSILQPGTFQAFGQTVEEVAPNGRPELICAMVRFR